MFRVTKQIDFCYGHRLLNYQGPCRHLHGHNGRVEVEIEVGALDERGMARDFSDLKTVVKTWIDSHLDHRILLHRDDPVLAHLKKTGEAHYEMTENPTAENISRVIYERMSAKIKLSKVTVWESPTASASYIGE